MVEVGRHGAFAVNRTGLDGAPFPLSFSAREASGSWMVDATAAQAAELADVLMRAANDTIVMVDLATNSFLDEDYVQWRPSRIAAEQGVNCQAHLLGALASGVGTGSGQRDRDKPDRGRRAVDRCARSRIGERGNRQPLRHGRAAATRTAASGTGRSHRPLRRQAGIVATHHCARTRLSRSSTTISESPGRPVRTAPPRTGR